MTNLEVALRHAADMFHEIVSARSAEDLLARETAVRPLNTALRDKLRGSLRSNKQICKIAADGFELCVRALATMGATDVTIHECSARDMEIP